MESFIEVLKIFLPSLVTGIIAFIIIRSFLKYEQSKSSVEIEKGKQRILIPARMQAYERIIMFLERITPENLIRRVLKTSMSSRLFQSDLISAIRSEYEHNISQQVYMSPAAWSMVKTATEETLRLINVTGSKLPATAMSTDLAQRMLEITSQINKFPTQVAIENIKKEFAQYFMSEVYTPDSNS